MATTRTIELVTEIPGPRSRALCERIERSVASPLALVFPIAVASARGATLTDLDGNTYIDFTGGIGSLNVGHSHPGRGRRRPGAARALQPHRLHAHPLRALRRRSPSGWRRRVPIAGPVKAAFFNSGAEAVENAVKFARAVHRAGRRVIAFEGAFHGRTLHGALAHLEGRCPTRRVWARSRPRSTASPSRAPTAASRASRRWRRSSAPSRRMVAPETVAAIIVEPVQGEGGFRVAPPEFLAGLRRALRPARDRPDRRRGADRLRPDGPLLRHRARGRRARSRSASPSRSPTACRSRACSAGPRSWTRPRPVRSAAPSSATRSRRRRRSRCST